MLLRGKTVVITGGSGGIGGAIKQAFLKEGAEVFNIDLRRADIKADVSNYTDIARVMTKISSRKNVIDVLINAAGIHGAIGFLPEINSDKWRLAIETNLFGTFNCIKAFFPLLKKSQRGKIINFSGGGATSPRPFFSAYSVSKVAVVRLTETLAEEFKRKKYKIDVNAIAPGAVNTRLLREAIAAGDKKPRNWKKLTPEKAVKLCLFLASDKSNGLSGKLISAVHDDWWELPNCLNEVMLSDTYTLRRIKPKKDYLGRSNQMS